MTKQGKSAAISVLLFTFVLCVGSGFAEEQTVNLEELVIGSIETAGNVTITHANILSTVRSRAGQKFDLAATEEDAKRLAKIEGVEYAYYNTTVVDGSITLTYVVVEKNLVRSINFQGNEKIKDNRLTKELSFKRGDYLDLFLAKSGIDGIKDYYIKKGYANIEVTLDESKVLEGQVTYLIKEGQRVKIKSVDFEGNVWLKKRELKKAIKTKKRKFLFWTVYYNQEVLEADQTKLKDAYRKKGYLDAVVASEVKFSEDNKLVYVTFNIEEGKLYIVEQVVIKGNTFFDDSVVRENLKLKEGLFYSEERAELDRRRIEGLYLEKGFVDAVVEEKNIYPIPGKVTTEFEIVAGDRFRIGEITISGNENVHDKAVRGILDEEGFSPGQWYNADIARGDGKGDLENRVKRRVLTESAYIRSTGDEPDSRDANVTISESQTGSVTFGAGVASNTGLMGNIILDQRNFDIFDWPESFKEFAGGKAFKGAGQRFRASWYPGTDQTSFSISFTEPYLYDKPVSLDTVFSGFDRVQESYDEGRTKVYLGIEKRYPDHWRRGISFRAENIDITDIDLDAPKEVKEVKGGTDLFGVRLSIRKDTTDSRFLPSSGYNFNASYEQVGGDFTYGVISGTQRWYKTVHEDLADRKTILETKIHAASIIGNAPTFEKFYAGGTGSIRGFDYRGVSPRGLQTNVANPQRKDPVGSDWVLLANTELAVPLTSEVFSWLFFADTGTVETGGIRASVGTGVQILLPQWFGPVPMRFEFAIPIAKDDTDDTRSFSFSVGALF